MSKYQYICLCTAKSGDCDHKVVRRIKLRGIFFIRRKRNCCLLRYGTCKWQKVCQMELHIKYDY